MAFEKGKSGNPGGRPKVVGEVQELARAHTKQAIETLAEIMQDTGAAAPARVAACNALLDRGYGKPIQAHEGETTHTHIHTIVEEVIFPDAARRQAERTNGRDISSTH